MNTGVVVVAVVALLASSATTTSSSINSSFNGLRRSSLILRCSVTNVVQFDANSDRNTRCSDTRCRQRRRVMLLLLT